MAENFETWRRRVAPPDEFEPGIPVAGAELFLRDVFDRRGAVSEEELEAEARRAQMDLARDAVALVLRDLHATTTARPVIDLREDDEYGLVITYNGGWSTPAIVSMQNPEATREIADYLRGEIVEDSEVWTAWPACPTHSNGLCAEIRDGRPTWYCRTGGHSVAEVGQLES